MSQDKISLLLLIPRKKLQKPAFQAFLTYTKSAVSRISVTFADPATDSVNPSEFDIILHRDCKLPSQFHTSCLLLDSPDAIQRVTDRVSVQQIICNTIYRTQLKQDHGSPVLSFPPTIVASVSTKSSLPANFFPAICKPLKACGSADCHQMSLVVDLQQLQSLDCTDGLMVQKFIPHYGVVFKVFAIGADKFWIVPRPSIQLPESSHSLPNDATQQKQTSYLTGNLPTALINWNVDGPCPNTFNTQDMQKSFDSSDKLPSRILSYIERRLISQLVSSMHEELNLTLFGFDLLVEESCDCDEIRKYHVIDINYFQGYDGVPANEFAHVLHDYLVDLV